jgi:hypothetical protein
MTKHKETKGSHEVFPQQELFDNSRTFVLMVMTDFSLSPCFLRIAHTPW